MIPKELETGHELIDKQHSNIILELALLKHTMEEGNLNPPVKHIMEFIVFLKDHFHQHFTDEENLMRHVHYPNLLSHEREHLAFFDIFMNLAARVQRENATIEAVSSFVSSIEKWIHDHVLEKDVWIARYIRGESIPALPEPRYNRLH